MCRAIEVEASNTALRRATQLSRLHHVTRDQSRHDSIKCRRAMVDVRVIVDFARDRSILNDDSFILSLSPQ